MKVFENDLSKFGAAIIRLPSVKAKTGLSRSEIYRREASGLFPKRVSLGARSVGWVLQEIDDWIMARIKDANIFNEIDSSCEGKVLVKSINNKIFCPAIWSNVQTWLPRAKKTRPPLLQGIKNLREIPITKEPGIYFLCTETEILYIGQSISPMVRVMNHVNGHKEFDRVFFMHCPEEHLNYLESKFIYKFNPTLNGRKTNGNPAAPMKIEEVAEYESKLINT